MAIISDDQHRSGGVYMLMNTLTSSVYVGATSVPFNHRWGQHRRDLRHNKHHNQRLQAEYNEIDIDPDFYFRFRILEVVNRRQPLREREEHWQTVLRAIPALTVVNGW